MNLYQVLKKYVEENFTSPICPIYHYTHSLQEIINTGYLKSNPHYLLNEKENSELKCGIEIIKNQLIKSSSLSHLLPRFHKYVKEKKEKEEKQENGLVAYTTSFCQERNSSHAIK